jgi:hypothetical protein
MFAVDIFRAVSTHTRPEHSDGIRLLYLPTPIAHLARKIFSSSLDRALLSFPGQLTAP